MFEYTLSNGDVMTTSLSKDKVIERMNRLDLLRVLTEGYESGEGSSIYRKALRAYNKLDGFTGIIRLNSLEKDFIGYMLENDMLSEKDRECLNFFLRIK